jgi:tetratricopeptide (TPR) repeat protein
VTRAALFIALLAANALYFERQIASRTTQAFDAVAPRARQVEYAIEAGRFVEALPIALELRDRYPHEALPVVWLAEIYRGTGNAAAEAAAWEQFITLGSSPAEACPGLAEAYAKSGSADAGVGAYERCVQLDPDEPERLVDLGAALEHAGRTDESLAAYRRAMALDPTNPTVAHAVERLSAGRGGSR